MLPTTFWQQYARAQDNLWFFGTKQRAACNATQRLDFGTSFQHGCDVD